MNNKQPIFRKLVVPMIGLTIFEILILVSSIVSFGVFDRLVDNEKSIVQEKVSGRSNYIESMMVDNWMGLDYTVKTINELVESQIADGTITLETIDRSSSDAAPLLGEASKTLISLLRSSHSSGVFMILNTEDLSQILESGKIKNKPGVYFRDIDPDSQAYSGYDDILAERAPVSVLNKLGIKADSKWKMTFEYGNKQKEYKDFFLKPFQAAYNNTQGYTWKDMGYWSKPYHAPGDRKTSIAYSVPLILSDGTVYGVMGIDVTLDLFERLVPYTELERGSQGAYFLARKTGREDCFTGMFGNGNFLWEDENGEDEIYLDPESYFYSAEELKLYNSGTPFSGDEWVMLGIVSAQSLYQYSRDVKMVLWVAGIVALIIGVCGCIVVCYQIHRPMKRLEKEIGEQDPAKMIKLTDTGIREVDSLVKSVEDLSLSVLDSDRRFTNILHMASVRMAVFQLDKEQGTYFVSEKFFELFNRCELDGKQMTMRKFLDFLTGLKQYAFNDNKFLEGEIFKVPVETGERYVRVKYVEEETKSYGLCEDVTQSFLEKMILQHERDYDVLTGLYNRRAFRRELFNILGDPSRQLQTGAMLMIDLDYLKDVNDTFGHGYGDMYIKQTAAAMRDSLPENALSAHISGDEFAVFLYGFADRESVVRQISELSDAIKEKYIMLPDGNKKYIEASGGVSWYPDDAALPDELLQYADYTMYTVKKDGRGQFAYFDREHFQNQKIEQKKRETLLNIIKSEQMPYAFQPIADVRTGKIHAYEALMRPNREDMSSPMDIMKIARSANLLQGVEKMTWFGALKAFVGHIEAGRINKDCRVFINSIPSQNLTEEQEQELIGKYREIMPRIVMELTEEEQIDHEKWENKQKLHLSLGGKIAMDDYGSGYNSEKMLLDIPADYIKVDIAIIKGIHLSADKQAVLTYITNYAHERGKYIIAEGVETEEELREVIRLGADYIQGYFVARPSLEPGGIAKEARRIILQTNNHGTAAEH